ncbi:hypothetical protein [Streptomyces prasinus]|uniref:hypothetical protein n=1 Tax=Streptomyces prasinus TaxID=67345 RepID=UPI0033BBD210
MISSSTIGPRYDVEEYRMRSSARYRGDLVHHHTREIGRRKYDFSRIEWGNGDVTVTAWIAGTTIAVHAWDGTWD